MKRPARRGALSAVLVSLLVISACGGDDEEAQAKSSISEHLMSQQSGQQVMKLKKKEADCISDGMVDGIGVDQLKEYKFLKEDGTVAKGGTTPEMSRKDSKTLVNSMFDCTDVMGTMKQQLSANLGQQSPEVKKCFDEELTEKRVRALLESTFAGEQDKAQRDLTGALMGCAMGGMGSPGGGAPSAGPDGGSGDGSGKSGSGGGSDKGGSGN